MADPERLRRHISNATGKSVDIVFPKPAKPTAAAADAMAAADLATSLVGLQL
jgi:hypothetical protein